MRRPHIAFCAFVLAVAGCGKADPNSIEDQIRILKSSRPTREKERAVENLRRIGKRDAVPRMVEALKDANSRVKGDLAVVLGELKDPSAVAGLVEAIDFSAGDGSDRMTKEANTANEKIARALGDIGDKAALKPLTQLLKNTRNNYVRIESIGALGRLKDPSAVPVLAELAEDERQETLINKKAIQALSQINHVDALPVYLRMAFSERRGVSFYPESGFGIFMLGEAARDRVLKLLSGQDPEIEKWAKDRKIITPALYAKAAQMETDLQDARAVPALLKLLAFKDPDEDVQAMVRMQAADALGRIRAKEAVAPLSSTIAAEREDVRGAYMRALAQIGNREALPKLIDCAQKGVWSAREYCLVGIVLMGSLKDAKLFDGYVKNEGALFEKECRSGTYGNVDCPAVRDENMKMRTDNLKSYQKALETIGACADSDAACFEKALGSADALVRERAAYELVRLARASSMPALMAAIKRPIEDKVDLNPRFAAICAVEWITSVNKEALAAAKAQVTSLEAQVEEDSKRMLTQKIAEEVKRLAVKLGR